MNIPPWFCGFSGETDKSEKVLPKPLAGKSVWEGKNPLWLSGSWKKEQLIKISDSSIQLAIVGTCLISYEDLVTLFKNAIKENKYNQLARLPGNYNLIIQTKDETLIFVDVAGVRPVFYTVYQSLIAYSSLATPLKQLIHAEVNLYWLANFLVTPTHLLNFSQGHSPFHHIQAIPPGHYLHISSGKPICQRYWNFPKEYSSTSEATEQLRRELLTAVEGRVGLYESISSDLSGGFDSSSLTLIAARELALQNRKLYSITAKSISPTEDLKWAKHAANLHKNIEHVIVEWHEIPGDYSELESIPFTDMPDAIMVESGRINYMMSFVKSQESQLHMSGMGGDGVISSSLPSYLIDLFKRGQISTFVQHTYGQSRFRGLSPIALMKYTIRMSVISYQQWWFKQARKFTKGKQISQYFGNKPYLSEVMGWDLVPQIMNWHTKKCTDLVAEKLQEWSSTTRPFINFPGEQQYIAGIQGLGLGCAIERQLAQSNDINLEFPFLDSLVIDACLRAKPEERTDLFAYKPLLSKALEQDFEKSFFSRTTKGEYSADRLLNSQENLAKVKKIFQTSVLADMDLINLKKLHIFIEQLSMGIASSSWNFHQTLGAELWLRRLIKNNDDFWV